MVEVNPVKSITSLVPDLLAGKEPAIVELVDRSFRRLIVTAMRYGAGTLEDAEEVAMDAIYTTLRKLPTLSFGAGGGKDPLFNYMVRSARNRTVDLHRSRANEAKALEEIGAGLSIGRASKIAQSTYEDSAEDEVFLEAAELIEPGGDPIRETDDIVARRAFLGTLSEDDRLMLRLHAENVLTSVEIGDEVNLSADAVRQRIKRLYDRFRKECHGS